ncbi:hypothetical protein E1B28_002787 [Marasmius oreades]|uniref:Uncharacterized protein n=1 Tax=Marasmius oreades TaxID=181124 RepID=A0A9P7UNF2_9AGAR|nr:uncharacterized protein E1B28_002787 [Marasmius oreades]KAG7086866.1 hypothetical protein E1B28_002787 [Marasmius oreades]
MLPVKEKGILESLSCLSNTGLLAMDRQHPGFFQCSSDTQIPLGEFSNVTGNQHRTHHGDAYHINESFNSSLTTSYTTGPYNANAPFTNIRPRTDGDGMTRNNPHMPFQSSGGSLEPQSLWNGNSSQSHFNEQYSPPWQQSQQPRNPFHSEQHSPWAGQPRNYTTSDYPSAQFPPRGQQSQFNVPPDVYQQRRGLFDNSQQTSLEQSNFTPGAVSQPRSHNRHNSREESANHVPILANAEQSRRGPTRAPFSSTSHLHLPSINSTLHPAPNLLSDISSNYNNSGNTTVHHQRTDPSGNLFLVNYHASDGSYSRVSNPSSSASSPTPSSLPGSSNSASTAPSGTQRMYGHDPFLIHEYYEKYLLTCCRGFPLYILSPLPILGQDRRVAYRCPPKIGDVGVIPPAHNFEALFNLFTASEGDNVPPGVLPAIDMPQNSSSGDSVSMACHYRPHTSFGNVLQRKSRLLSKEVTYELPLKGYSAAALILPRGSHQERLKVTYRKAIFNRVKRYGLQWLDFTSHTSFYVVTGTETCSAWATAVWDSGKSTRAKFHSGKWDWTGKYIHGRGEVRKYPPTKKEEKEATCMDQTAFLIGFWMDWYGNMSDGRPGLPPQSQHSPSNQGGGAFNPGGGSDSAPDRYSGTSNEPSGAAPQTYPYGPGGNNWFTTLNNLHPVCLDDSSVQEVKIRFDLDIISYRQPCQLINKFGYLLVRLLDPAASFGLFFSHDDHWMSVIEESDDVFPDNDQFCERFCAKYKYVLEDDTIFPEELSANSSTTPFQRTTMTLVFPHHEVTAVVEVRGQRPSVETPLTARPCAGSMPGHSGSSSRQIQVIHESFIHHSRTLISV